MEFEWDDSKHQRNLHQRGLGFDFAALIFEGPVIILADERYDYGEKRQKAIGEIEGIVVTVVFTDRGEFRRIIAAWPASRQERKLWRSQG
jgi:uncharacterized DUF497 family protein